MIFLGEIEPVNKKLNYATTKDIWQSWLDSGWIYKKYRELSQFKESYDHKQFANGTYPVHGLK